MNLTRIEYFLATAKYLSFTKAADVLYISQPSLSKQIALLERELGLTLFDRSKRALSLTPAGAFINLEFNRLLPEMETIVEKAKRMTADTAKTLFLGNVEAITLGDTAEKIVNRFITENDDVDLFIERCGFDALQKKLLEGSIDVAFTISTQIRKSKDIVSAEIEKRKSYVIMSVNHKLASKDNVQFEDLRDETFALYSKETSMISYDNILEECQKVGFFPKIRYAPNNSTILDYLELGGCVAFFDKSIAESRKDRLKYYPLPLETRFSLVCVWKQSNTNPALHKFIKILPK